MSIDDAIRHHEAGRLREAEELYRSMLDANPRDPDILHLLGVLLSQRGEYDDAVAHILAALEIERDSVRFLSSLSQVYFRAGKLGKAVAVLEEVVGRQPDSFQGFSDLGAVLQESGELERAIAAYQRSIELNPRLAIVHFNLGTALKLRGDTTDAISCVEKALALDPSQASFAATLAGYYLEAGKPDTALRACKTCLALAPRNLTALTFMSIALDRLGDREGAARIVDFDRLIQSRRLTAPAGYEDISEFNRALADHVRNHPTLNSEISS